MTGQNLDGGSGTVLSTVLLIDTDEQTAKDLEEMSPENGWRLVWTTKGKEGVGLAESSDCDIILLELNLPDLAGRDVCRQVRTMGVEVPIMVLSRDNDLINIVVSFELGGDDFIVKPYLKRELEARINAHLRRHRLGGGKIKEGRKKFPGLIIDSGRHEVLREGVAITLTPTEFRLLEMLTESEGRVVSRAQMIQEIWPTGTDLDERSVDAHIYRLRKKITLDRTHPLYIRAVAGIGYSFDPRRKINS